jgi:hypothetical protein
MDGTAIAYALLVSLGGLAGTGALATGLGWLAQLVLGI